MTPQQRENLRLGILLELQSNASMYGTPQRILQTRVRVNHNVPTDDDDFNPALLYLTDAQMIVCVTKEVSPEMRAWRITKTGTDYLASRGYY